MVLSTSNQQCFTVSIKRVSIGKILLQISTAQSTTENVKIKTDEANCTGVMVQEREGSGSYEDAGEETVRLDVKSGEEVKSCTTETPR